MINSRWSIKLQFVHKLLDELKLKLIRIQNTITRKSTIYLETSVFHHQHPNETLSNFIFLKLNLNVQNLQPADTQWLVINLCTMCWAQQTTADFFTRSVTRYDYIKIVSNMYRYVASSLPRLFSIFHATTDDNKRRGTCPFKYLFTVSSI